MKSVICAVVVVLVSQCQGQLYPNPMCTTDPTSTVGPNDPRLPQVLPPSFQVHIEATMIERKESLTADEYVDVSAGMSSMVIRQMGQVESLILNYNTNESYHIVNQQCTVQNQALDPNDVFIGGSVGNSKIPHTYSTGTVLRFAQKYGEVYKGQSTIRGISTDHWQSCMYWPFLNVNFTLDYYFTRQNWTTADGSPQIPVRAEVQGYNNLLGAGPGSSFHHIYDYVGFMSYVQDPTVFQTPKGIPCPGRVKIRQMPALKPQYQYREEITSVLGASVTQADIWYDYNYHLVRFDYRPASYAYPYYSLDAVTEIHDFNTGVAYVIDKTFGNCSIVPIENSTWDASRNVSQVPLHLKSPEQLFYLDSTYAYAGQRTVRGIQCDVFSTIKTNYSDGGLMGMNVSFEVYFMSDDWTSSNNVGDDTSSPDTPVRLEISEPITGYDVVYDFFDFDQEHPDIVHAFDITPCFNDQQKVDFQITFPGDATDFLLQYQIFLLDLSIIKIATIANISPIRMQKLALHWDEDNSYLVGTLLDKPPALAKFRRWPNLVAEYADDLMLQGVTDAFTCASSCDLQTQATCNSFDICPQAQTCAESLHYTSDGKELKQNTNCDHYSRVLSGAVDHEMALNDAFIVLKDTVYTGSLVIPVMMTTPVTINRVFKASDITTEVLRDPAKGSTNQASAMTKFIGQSNKIVSGYNDMILTGMAIDDCAAQCLSMLEFTCESFEYCLSNGNCILSRIQPAERLDLVKNNASCDLYSRDYTSKYTELQGTTVLSSSDTIYQNINNPNQCAKLCSDYQSFPCKSFDYCPDISACFLGHKHVFDMPKANVKQSPTCDHYSRNYASDFKMSANKQIKLNDNRIIMSVSVEQCAKMCVEEMTFSCASFDYCGNTTECRLSTASMSDVGQVTLESTAFCSIYNRQYYPSGQTYVPHVDNSAKYTSGAMGGLGFAMLVIGLLLGVGLLFGWTKYKGRYQDDMAVSFSNKDTLSDN